MPPEAALWGQVVERAIDDVCMWFSLNKAEVRLARKAASWMFSSMQEQHFHDVCGHAGLDPDAVRKWTRRKWEAKVPVEWSAYIETIWQGVSKP